MEHLEPFTEAQAIAHSTAINHADLFSQDGYWWAFPPNGVMSVQIGRVLSFQDALEPRFIQMAGRVTRSQPFELSESISSEVFDIAARSLGIEPGDLLSAIERGEATYLNSAPDSTEDVRYINCIHYPIPTDGESEPSFSGFVEHIKTEIIEALRIPPEALLDSPHESSYDDRQNFHQVCGRVNRVRPVNVLNSILGHVTDDMAQLMGMAPMPPEINQTDS